MKDVKEREQDLWHRGKTFLKLLTDSPSMTQSRANLQKSVSRLRNEFSVNTFRFACRVVSIEAFNKVSNAASEKENWSSDTSAFSAYLSPNKIFQEFVFFFSALDAPTVKESLTVKMVRITLLFYNWNISRSKKFLLFSHARHLYDKWVLNKYRMSQGFAADLQEMEHVFVDWLSFQLILHVDAKARFWVVLRLKMCQNKSSNDLLLLTPQLVLESIKTPTTTSSSTVSRFQFG